MPQFGPILVTTALTGCSLLYNPNNLPPAPVEAGVDASMIDQMVVITDVNPDAITVTGLDTIDLYEGIGDGGSVAQILVVRGSQFFKNMTTVEITAFDGTSDTTSITVDNTQLDVADTGNELAVPVTFAVDPSRDHTAAPLRLQVTVKQAGAAGTVTAHLPDEVVLTAHFLDELTGSSTVVLAGGLHEYSSVSIDAGGITCAAGGLEPLRIRANASINVTGAIAANASGKTAGCGGFNGGMGGAAVGAAGEAGFGGGGGAGGAAGGGGGFGVMAMGAGGGAMVGDATLATLDLPNRGSGGGGANGGLLGTGGNGGGGGGSIEITAGGDIVVGDVTATGGNGSAGTGVTPGGGGGGGSGGAILIRGRTTTVGAVAALGGMGNAAGNGAVGRIRVDTTGTSVTTDPVAYRGPMLAFDTARILRNSQPTLTVVGKANRQFSFLITNAAGNMTRSGTQTIASTGTQIFTLATDQTLFFGANRICLIVEGADISSNAEALNCSDLGYLFKQ